MNSLAVTDQTLEIQLPSVISLTGFQNIASNSTLLSWHPGSNNVTKFAYEVSSIEEILRCTVGALNTYAVPVICVLGIFGDVASFLVFVFSSFRYQPCSQCLAALTFVDTMFLVSQLNSSFMTFFPSLASAPGYCSVIVYMSYVCSFLSVWFVVLMMVERYIVVCHPFKASAICSKTRSVTLILALTVLSLILYSHSFFTTSESVLGDPCSASMDYYDFLSIFTYMDSVLVFGIPFLALLWLNLRIIFTVRKFRLQHNIMNQSIGRSQRYHNANKTLSLAQVRSTKTLVWVSSVFLVLYLPSYAVRLYGLVLRQIQGGEIDEESRLRLYIAQQICQFLYHVNFAIDFIVYVMTSNIFRRNVSQCFRNIHTCKLKCQYLYQY